MFDSVDSLSYYFFQVEVLLSVDGCETSSIRKKKDIISVSFTMDKRKA